jgi:transitional endoplasmic reticulum ATPase
MLAVAIGVAVLAIAGAFALGILFEERNVARAKADAALPVPLAPLPSAPVASTFHAIAPGDLPKFADLGGMDELKAELTDTLDLLLATSGDAAAYHVSWNGVLLYGPPGVGKTMVAHATAGQFDLTLVPITAGDLLAATRGESARNVDAAFEFALAHQPALLFFDEFDAIARRRDDSADLKQRAVVGELVAGLERTRETRGVIVMAATNDLNSLDRAVIRPGHFDRQIRVDLPDRAAREAIFRTCLDGLPADGALDVADLARRSEGMSPAAIAHCVRSAALEAFAESRRTKKRVVLTNELLVASLHRGGEDRPTVEEHTWDTVILADDTKAQLQELQYLLADPDSAARLGVDPPSGVLLAGPPGNGKTTIAKVLAAQARCSFYPVSAADITSKWYGQAEENIARLFERARDNRPSIIFIDELDGLAPHRGEMSDATDRVLGELLSEIDGMAGQAGVLVVGATNRPDQIDSALLRGGRLSRTIDIPLPDEHARLAMLQLFSAKMPLDRVDLGGIAAVTEGWSGGDLRALCQEAALLALVAAREHGQPVRVVTEAEFERALEQRAPATLDSGKRA